jgi:hypothetical protein
MNNILDLIDFERREEYVLADVKSATWFFECVCHAPVPLPLPSPLNAKFVPRLQLRP